ncbi:hypothetical protein [Idiomarina sp. UBA3162]|uniref:hypothetical protein n=1 Tax=Idiomarina sp. UBA3162 TaxID=1946641 RepID=UPI000C8D4C73|nr:hypothetical protein [Idiomarina sp. UBA3162]MAD53448.1 hypothetical protein [Idiomarinaceae bacterium]
MKKLIITLSAVAALSSVPAMAQDSQESSIRSALQTEVSSISESLWQASKDAVVSTLDEITTELFSEEALASRESRDDSAESNDDNKSE